MRNVTAVIMASALALTLFPGQVVEANTGDRWHQVEETTQHNIIQQHMFDGISLTEQQRQQMRDLMHLAKHSQSPVNVSELEVMHRLITSENFDEKAVRIQAEKMAREQVARQVEMAKVRNQMFRLLTPEQRAILNDKHHQLMNELREIADQQTHSILQLSSSNP
ncbi:MULTISPECIES: cell-envelope stress modulator CpxP [Tenebrionibacter/Tenebrionicola group]|jgi:protein CpxP|uniref:Cell-envelope stress modulator CpxP n=2 Tax=Tenebrionibacter/Tenebrionicola group TaxID=2969848 RepID=A0A8K0V579_9ENTR|nr:MULTISPECIES: cell-envelope stress modulator CpxP [Tenebrionibacter/Tenebrionicola group]MBK4714355.1 cell-envelope stress modulator CpxP [Tenebrionibacter intestinalis]MBV4414277.1 cell-envelope stress modulator CpxP [Tenebrionicola larvae]MBV5095238.1 cell-envelope stress modulator CpxP [Tenebrionicola larvae]